MGFGPETHKRLLLIASIGLLPPALAGTVLVLAAAPGSNLLASTDFGRAFVRSPA